MNNFANMPLLYQVFFKIKELEENNLHCKNLQKNYWGSSPRGIEEIAQTFKVENRSATAKEIRIVINDLLDNGKIYLDDHLNLVVKK